MRVQLRETAVITLDGSGNGTAILGPISSRETWYPNLVSVSVNTPITNEASCKVYVGDSPNQQNFRDATLSGSTGDVSDAIAADTIKVGYKVWSVFAGGDAGHIGMMIVTGEKDV